MEKYSGLVKLGVWWAERDSFLTSNLFFYLTHDMITFLVTCREVSKWWQKFIDEQKTIPLRKLQARNQLQSLVKFAKCFEKIRNFPFSIVHWWNKEFHPDSWVKLFHKQLVTFCFFWKISLVSKIRKSNEKKFAY